MDIDNVLGEALHIRFYLSYSERCKRLETDAMNKDQEFRKIRVRHRGAPVFRRLKCIISVNDLKTAAAAA